MVKEKIKLDIRGVHLRSWNPADAESMAKYANDKRIWLNMRDEFPFPFVVEDAERMIDKFSSKDQFQFAISNDNEAIGSIGVVVNNDIRRKSAVLSYWLGQPFWGKGIASYAVEALSNWVFLKKDIVRLYAKIFANNPASKRVLEKAGYSLEGHFRKAIIKEGKFIDQLLFAKVI